jgi:hypothetical protein
MRSVVTLRVICKALAGDSAVGERGGAGAATADAPPGRRTCGPAATGAWDLRWHPPATTHRALTAFTRNTRRVRRRAERFGTPPPRTPAPPLSAHEPRGDCVGPLPRTECQEAAPRLRSLSAPDDGLGSYVWTEAGSVRPPTACPRTKQAHFPAGSVSCEKWTPLFRRAACPAKNGRHFSGGQRVLRKMDATFPAGSVSCKKWTPLFRRAACPAKKRTPLFRRAACPAKNGRHFSGGQRVQQEMDATFPAGSVSCEKSSSPQRPAPCPTETEPLASPQLRVAQGRSDRDVPDPYLAEARFLAAPGGVCRENEALPLPDPGSRTETMSPRCRLARAATNRAHHVTPEPCPCTNERPPGSRVHRIPGAPQQAAWPGNAALAGQAGVSWLPDDDREQGPGSGTDGITPSRRDRPSIPWPGETVGIIPKQSP